MNLLIVALFGVLVVMMGFVAFMVYWKSFKNKVYIARQTGEAVGDVVWIEDRFKVSSIEGRWTIIFRKIPEKTNSLEGKFWTKFIKKQKEWVLDKEKWDKYQMSKLVQRGLFLYETSEGVFFPMQINREDADDGKKDGKISFKIIDQDNRMFLIEELRNNSDLTKDRRREIIGIVAVAIAFVVLGIAFVFGFMYISDTSQTAMQTQAAVCNEYFRTLANITQNQQSTFIGDVLKLPGG